MKICAGLLMRVLIFICLLSFTLSARCELADSLRREDTSRAVHSLWVTTGADYVARSSGDEIRPEIRPENRIGINTAVPANIRYSFSLTNPNIKHYLPGGYQGIGTGVLNFGALEARGVKKSCSNIGYPVLLYLFQGGPFHHFNSRLRLDYEWNFGASFGWKPYSQGNQNFSLAVGSRVNAYLHLGLNLRYDINPHSSVFVGVGVSHFSNGNTSFPNPGVNLFGLRMGMVWTLNPMPGGFLPPSPDTIGMKKVTYDILAWGASRKRMYKGGETPVLLKGHFASSGISFAPMVRLNTWWRVGGSLDLQWDQSSDLRRNYIEGNTPEDIKFTTPRFLRQVTVGISAHGELRMPIFAVNLGCGYNIVAPWENRGSYQNIALKTYIGETFFINVGYQLRNFHQQSSLMLGVGVTLGS